MSALALEALPFMHYLRCWYAIENLNVLKSFLVLNDEFMELPFDDYETRTLLLSF